MSENSITHTEIAYCDFSADFENVSKVAARLKHFCQLRGLDETLWPSIELGLCEALNNAVEHGCQEDSSLTVKTSWKWIDSKLIIEIEDPSKFEAASEKAELPEDPLSDSGRGSFIIDSVFDNSEHRKTSYGHSIILTKEVNHPLDMLAQMQAMYESLQSLTNEMGLCYNKIDTLENLSHTLAAESTIDSLIEKSCEAINTISNIDQTEFWISNEKFLTKVYPSNKKDGLVPQKILLDSNTQEVKDFLQNSQCVSIKSDNSFIIKTTVEFRGEKIGLLTIKVSQVNEAFVKDNLLKAISLFAMNIGIAQNHKVQREREKNQDREDTQMEIASEIQKSFLPSSFPNNEYCKMTGKCVSAMAVGGDYIDTIEIPGQGLLIVIADVMGKGVPAAMLATIFRTAIRSRLNLAETPGWLLSKINKQIHDELGHLNMFITAQAAFYTYEKKILKLASAGHCPALLLNCDNETVGELSADGIPLGIDANDIYEEILYDLDTGDRVLFITDGLYEAENSEGQMLGIDRLSQKLPSLWNEGIDSLPTKAFDLVSDFSSDRSLQDDQTLMALEIL